MIRTQISLDEDDRRWLDELARERGVSMAHLVREAIALSRERERSQKATFEELLEASRGIGTQGDGLEFQRRLRAGG